jgi:hypothetical protein
MPTPWQKEEPVDEPPQPDRQDREATESHDPATEDDDEKRR